jgi:hypothetical protein
MKDRKAKQVLSGGRYQWKRGEEREMVKTENLVNVLCICIGK